MIIFDEEFDRSQEAASGRLAAQDATGARIEFGLVPSTTKGFLSAQFDESAHMRAAIHIRFDRAAIIIRNAGRMPEAKGMSTSLWNLPDLTDGQLTTDRHARYYNADKLFRWLVSNACRVISYCERIFFIVSMIS